MRPALNRRLTMLIAIALTASFAVPLTAQEALANREVVEMTAAGLSEDLVVKVVRGQAAAFDLSPRALIELRRQGVSENVLDAMIERMPASESGGSRMGGVTVPDGTVVRLRLKQTVSSATAQERELLLFEAVEDVEVGGVTVIAGGAEGRGRVLRSQHRKSFGRRGRLEFSIEAVEAVDGQPIRLRAHPEHLGKDLYGTAGVVTLLTGPFGVFVKGKDVEVPAGTEYTIYIDGERRVNLPPDRGDSGGGAAMGALP